MRARLLGLLLTVLALPALLHAQVAFVTVIGSNANYANGTLTANFAPPPNTSANSYSGQRFPFTQSATLNSSGAWSLVVADNTTLIPAGSQWQLNLCSQKASYLPAPTCYLVTVPVTCVNNASCSGLTLNLTSTFASAPAPSGGSGTSGGVITAASANQLPHWIACTAKVKINTGNCRIYAVGDSTTFGTFSNGTNVGNLTLAAYPTRLSQYLNNALLPAQRDSFMGDGTFNETTGVNDARVTLGSWVQANGGANPLLITTGGDLFTATAGATPLAFLPTDTVDTFRLWYITNTGLGSFSYNVDGGTATTINENGSQVFNSVTIAAGSLGIHTLNLTWISGSVFVAGVEAYNSAIGSVQIINAGWAGATSANWVTQGNPWNPVPGVTTQAPDVILLSLGINDWRVTQTSTSVSAYMANVQALITAWKVNSDVILVTPAPSGISTVPLATQQQYVAALYSLAATNNLPIIDNFGRWVSFERMNPAPYLFYSSNNLHPNGNGYSDFAQSIASQLMSVVGH